MCGFLTQYYMWKRNLKKNMRKEEEEEHGALQWLWFCCKPANSVRREACSRGEELGPVVVVVRRHGGRGSGGLGLAVAWTCQWQTIWDRSNRPKSSSPLRRKQSSTHSHPTSHHYPSFRSRLVVPRLSWNQTQKIDNSIKIELFYHFYPFKLIMLLNILIYFRLI